MYDHCTCAYYGSLESIIYSIQMDSKKKTLSNHHSQKLHCVCTIYICATTTGNYS